MLLNEDLLVVLDSQKDSDNVDGAFTLVLRWLIQIEEVKNHLFESISTWIRFALLVFNRRT